VSRELHLGQKALPKARPDDEYQRVSMPFQVSSFILNVLELTFHFSLAHRAKESREFSRWNSAVNKEVLGSTAVRII
jgi:hypothetical protein